jgi:hypothetical protein
MTKLDTLIAASMAELIDYFVSQLHLALIASYCINREKGLKKQANADVLAFIAATQQLDISTQRAIALELTELFFFTSFQLFSTPLLRYFGALMQDWALAEPNNDVPLCWLAYLSQDRDYYARAFAINPNNAFALCWVIHEHLNDADRQTHVSHALKNNGDCDTLKNTLNQVKNGLIALEKLIANDKIQYANYVRDKANSLQAELLEYESIYDTWLKNKAN